MTIDTRRINLKNVVPKSKIVQNSKTKLFTCSHTGQSLPIRFRPRTMDRNIFKYVVDRNEYRLPNILDPKDIIIDIGAHIGCFTYACLKRGAKKIYSYEPFKDNYDIAKSNFDNEIKTGIVKLYNLAVWRSDISQEILYYVENSANTGGGSVTCEPVGNIQINTIQLDRIIDEITNSSNVSNTASTTNATNRIKLVKLDCEGSEFPILFTSKKLSLIDYICGEYHPTTLKSSDNVTHFDGNDIVSYLDGQGFSTIIIGHQMGLFFAKKKGYDNFFDNTIIS